MITYSSYNRLNWSKTASFKEANSTVLNHWFLGETSCLRHAFMRTNVEAQQIIFGKWHCVEESAIHPLLEVSRNLSDYHGSC